jgi:hypothetical protein
MKKLVAIAIVSVLLTCGIAIAVPFDKNTPTTADSGFMRGMHFGGVYPSVDTLWPDVATVHPWVDNKTYPTPENVSMWAYNANANCLFFTSYYGPLYGAIGANNTYLKPADDYLEALANNCSQRNMELILMILPKGSYYGMFSSNIVNVANHMAQISINHTNIRIEFDEPDWAGIPESTFTGWVNAVKNVNPDCFVTVGLDYPRGTPSTDQKWWSHCDGVMLIDYWASSATALKPHIQTWVNSIDPKPVWTFIPTGDVGTQVGGVNLDTQATLDYLDVAITYSEGSFIFDRGGIWVYGGWDNPYDNGTRYQGITDRYALMLVPEHNAILVPIGIAAFIPVVIIITERKRAKGIE